MLPVHIAIDAAIKQMDEQGVFYYILQRGERNSGTILLKISNRQGSVKLLTQQRNLEGDLCWIPALNQETIEETQADDYIQRSVQRDPDLWVIEIEDPAMQNPFKEFV